MKKVTERLKFEQLSRREMILIIGGSDDGSKCYVDECKSDTTVQCEGTCTSSGMCAWCDADVEGTKKCCLGYLGHG